MKILATADWQCDFSNLDNCYAAKAEVFSLAASNNVSHLVIAGDAKQQYNPVDTRVTRFWVQFIRDAISRGLVIDFLLGNHDRNGQYADAQNWLPIFAAAGAKTYASPTVVNIGKMHLCFLPYMSSVEDLKRSARTLARQVKHIDSPKLLFFHCDVKDSKYSYVTPVKSEAKLTVADLFPQRYDFCLGGHIHLPQALAGADNAMFIGNPFATDWGEANQVKQYVLFDSDTRELTIEHTKIPGWYDKTVKGYEPPHSWKGVRLRIHVPVASTDNYVKVVEKARKKAEANHKGALVFTVAEFEDASKEHNITLSTTDPDHVKVRAYVEETVPVELRKQTEKIISYLSFKLARVGGSVRATDGLTFLWARARNMLSFKELKVDFRKQGLVVVQGQHLNWPRRSNGAGKTNFLQPIPIALFGKTFKGQKLDKWAREKTKDAAEVTLAFRDRKGHKIKITRGRRPGKLQMLVDGEDQSSGMKSTQKNGTQMLIEQLSGFTWDTLANAVYIDSAVVNAFLAGTTKARADVLAKIQNLERFDVARKLVNKEYSKLASEIKETAEQYDTAEANLAEFRELLVDIKADAQFLYDTNKIKLKGLQTVYAKAEAEHKLFEKRCEKKRKRLTEEVEAFNKTIVSIDQQWIKLRDRITVLTSRLALRTKAAEAFLAGKRTTCDACHQPINRDTLADGIESLAKIVRLKEKKFAVLDKMRRVLLDQAALWEGEHDKLAMDIAASERSLFPLSTKIDEIYDRGEELQKTLTTDNSSSRKLKKKIKREKARLHILKKLAKPLQLERAFYEYCLGALSRDGIPLFLNTQLCPVLNKAAMHYSEIFSENEIQVRFNVVDGEFIPQIVNMHGSDQTNGQSVGERALAGVITSFALRGVTPLCNILVLDEPGGGLDSENAKCFALGLRKLASQFDTIFVVTHNPIILGELAGENRITITKKQGISSVEYDD
jgi:DNA repair exonuclease SbcCD ATPase subunit